MQSTIEHEKRAVGKYMEQFFHELLLRVGEFRDANNTIPQPKADDIIHLYLQTRGLDFQFAMDYAGRDRMTLGGLLNPTSGELTTGYTCCFGQRNDFSKLGVSTSCWWWLFAYSG